MRSHSLRHLVRWQSAGKCGRQKRRRHVHLPLGILPVALWVSSASMAGEGGYAPLETTADDDGPGALGCIDMPRATAARSEVVVAVERDAMLDELTRAEDKSTEKTRRFCVLCQSPEEIQQESVLEAEQRHATALEATKAAADAVSLDVKIDALWGWVEGALNNDSCIKYNRIVEMAAKMQVEREELCALLGLEAVRGPQISFISRGQEIVCRYGFGPMVIDYRGAAVVATDPPCAEADLANAAALRGKLALVQGGLEPSGGPEAEYVFSEDGPLGIAFETLDGCLQVSGFIDGSVAQSKGLSVGSKLLRFQDITLRSENVDEVTSSFKTTPRPWSMIFEPEVTFAEKVNRVTEVGAVALIVVNNEPGDKPFQPSDNGEYKGDIPVLGVSAAGGAQLAAGTHLVSECTLEGTAVRHKGRRGAVATGPCREPWEGEDSIQIRWEDDGTLSDKYAIKVSELELEVTVGREDFDAACAKQPERTAKMHAPLGRESLRNAQKKLDKELTQAKLAAAAFKNQTCRVRCRRSFGCQSSGHIKESLHEAEARHAAAPEVAAALPLEAKIEALWAWSEGTRSGCLGRHGERIVKYGEIAGCHKHVGYGEFVLIPGMAEAAKMDIREMCDLLGAQERDPVRGPRAALDGRDGTVCYVSDAGTLQIRWGAAPTEGVSISDQESSQDMSPWVDHDDAIKVDDPDLVLGEGSAVRHDGRRGTAATHPAENRWRPGTYAIRIHWEDDGTLSEEIKVLELDVEVTVGREEFATACVQHPERTARMHAQLAQRQADVDLDKAKKAAEASKQSCGVYARRICAYRGSCRQRCKFCCFKLLDYQPVRGYSMPDFLKMLGGVTMPTMDAWLDWSVTIAFYLSGDLHWFEAGLTINLLSGLLSGGCLAYFLRNPHRSPTGDAQGGDEEMIMLKQHYRWPRWKVCGIIAMLGLTGLAPVMCTVMVLRGKRDIHLIGGAKVLKFFKATELIVENVPQSVLQTYVGVAYGKFDPSSPTFSYLLPVSVTVSLLGAGFTVFGLEAEMRNAAATIWVAGAPTYKEVVSLGSRYGIVGSLLRTAQVTALIFWISLLGCAVKGWAVGAVVLGVLVFGCMCVEAVSRKGALGWWGRVVRLWQPHNSVRAKLLWSAIHATLLGGMAAGFFAERFQGWWAAGASVSLVVVVVA